MERYGLNYLNRFRTDYRPILVTTKEQIDTMVQFMEEPRNFGLALNLVSDLVQKQKLWTELVEILNSMGPPVRNLYRWRKVWNDLKSRSRNKYIAKNEYLLNPATTRLPKLTVLDERMIHVLGLEEPPNDLVRKYKLHKAQEEQEEELNLTQNIVIKRENEEYVVDNYDDQNYEPENDEQTITIEEALDILRSVEDDDCDNNNDNDADLDNNDVENFLNSPEHTNVLDSIFNVDDGFNNNNGKRIEEPFIIDDSGSDDNNQIKKHKTENFGKDFGSNQNQANYVNSKLNEQPIFNLIISDAKTINTKSKSSTSIISNKINSDIRNSNTYNNIISRSSSTPMNNCIPSTSSKVNETKSEQFKPNINLSKSFKRCRHGHGHTTITTKTNNNEVIQKQMLSALNETNLTLKLFNKNLEKLLILKKYDMTQRNELASRKLELYNKELELKNRANEIELAKIVFNKKMKIFNK